MAKRILIGEDEKPMARALELKLAKSGFETKAVFDGAQVLEEIAKNKYDLLVLDLIMPIKDGFAVMEELYKKKNKVPIIISSNLGQNEDISRAKKLGAVDYFIKSDTPINVVVEHIKKIFKIK